MPAQRARRGARRDEQLDRRFGADHRADVAAVEHRARRAVRESALLVDQHAPHRRNDRNPGGGVGDGMGRQRFAVEVGEIDEFSRLDGARLVVQRPAPGDQHRRDGAVGQPGVEIGQVVIVGEPARERALAGRGGAVDGDDEGGGNRHR